MRRKGGPLELENRRRLAVRRVLDGWSVDEAAEFLEVGPRTVRGWVAAFRAGGDAALAAKPQSGRPRKLDPQQEQTVLSWLSQSAVEFGFADELWTAPRVAQLIERTWKITFHPRYLNQWFAARKVTSQKPRSGAREADPAEIVRWAEVEWRRIKKNAATQRLHCLR